MSLEPGKISCVLVLMKVQANRPTYVIKTPSHKTGSKKLLPVFAVIVAAWRACSNSFRPFVRKTLYLAFWILIYSTCNIPNINKLYNIQRGNVNWNKLIKFSLSIQWLRRSSLKYCITQFRLSTSLSTCSATRWV